MLGRGGGTGSLRMSVVLDEAVLLRSAGSAGSADDPGGATDAAAIRSAQLRHLLTAAAGPSVELRILPFAAGIPPVGAGSFSILESAATGNPDLVYLENKTRISFIDGDEVDRYVRDHRLLTASALEPPDSADLLAELIRR